VRPTVLAATLPGILALPRDESARLVSALVEACAAHQGRFVAECAWAVRIATLYPGDSGVVIALLLNLVHLEPREAIYMEAGHLHAYLSGLGVEIMAASDNVLRGGLTPKHVDVPELLRVLNFVDGPATVRRARPLEPDEAVWDTPAPEFRLSRIRVAGSPIARAMQGPEILLCVDGRVRVVSIDGASRVPLERGQAAFVQASAARYTLEGDGAVFRATVGSV
jgi:mannose-6-phosphate isomerase